MNITFNKILLWSKQHPSLFTAIILALLILVFISPSFFHGRYLAPVDIHHFIAPYLDITTQMLPWYKLSAELIQNGNLPLWNIHSGLGLPLLANMQSAVFFPLTWFFYIFSIKIALLLYSFTKLLLMGMFTYWYLRELKLRYSISLIGAILFTFCGVNTIWFLWPLTSVILTLPLSFWLLEKYFNTLSLKYAFWFTPIIAIGLLSGHPQTFFYIFCAIFGYTLFKTFYLSGGFLVKLKHLVIVSGFYLSGFLLSAISLLPFIEYVGLSANLDYREGFTENPFFLPKALFLANFIPDFYGNLGVKNFSYLLVPNYGELALGYIGVSGLVLSVFAFARKMRKEILFFSGAALLSAALIYRAPLIYSLINKLPGFNLNYNNRLLYLWAFFLVVLACFGLERLMNSQISLKRFRLTWLGFAGIAGILIVVNKFLTKGWDFAHNLDWHTVSLWQNVMIVGFIANLVLAYLIIKKLPNRKALIVLTVLICIETVLHGMIFLRTSTPDNFYPTEPVLAYLQTQSPDNYRVFTYGDVLLPNIGTWYGINHLNDHDTIYLRSNKRLKQAVANYNYSPEYTRDNPNLNALRSLSVKYLLYPTEQSRDILEKYPQDLTIGYTDNQFTVLNLSNPLPRAFILTADNESEVQIQMQDLLLNPTAHDIATVTNFEQKSDGTQIINYEFSPNSYLITVDNYYPDWFAQFNTGKTQTMFDINGLRGVALEPNTNSLTISYQSASLQAGAKISLFTLLIWLVIGLLYQKKGILTAWIKTK